MVDVNGDGEQTLDQSNSGEADHQSDESVEQSQGGDSQTDGQAADGGSESDDSGQESEGHSDRGQRRHEKYIDKLAAEIQHSNELSTRYTEEIFSPKPYKPLEYKDGEEFDTKALEEDRRIVSDNSRAEGLQQGLRQGTNQMANELWVDRFEADAERVLTRYKDLEDDSKLEATMVQRYIAYTGMQKDGNGRVSIQRPNVRFKDFVEAEMQNLENYATRHRETTEKNLTRQASRTGVRPNGQARSTKGDHGFDPNDPAGSVARMTSEQYHKLGGREASDAYLSKRGLGPKA